MKSDKIITLRLFLIVFIFIFCITSKISAAPTLPDPITQSTSNYTVITGDYGPRNFIGQINSNTNPHIGIDYRLSEGGKAYAVEKGDIKRIYLDKPTEAFIKIGDWRYIHMISNEYKKKDNYWFQVKKDQEVMDKDGKPTGKKTTIIVFREYENKKWVTKKALHIKDTSIPPFKWKDTDNSNQEIMTSNSITQTDITDKDNWVFCARDLGASDHLHIDYKEGAENPLKYICYKDGTEHVIYPKYKYFKTDTEAANFTTKVDGKLVIYNYKGKKVIVQSGVNYTGDKDLEKTQIFIRKTGTTDYAKIKEWDISNSIKHGSNSKKITSGEQIYVDKDTNDAISKAVKEGVYPQLDVVSKDFYKFHWDTFKYIDGTYDIKMQSIDITEHKKDKEEKIIIDNTRPYVKLIKLAQQEPTSLYQSYWYWDAIEQKIKLQTCSWKLLTGKEISINIGFSEPVKDVSISIEKIGVVSVKSDEAEGSKKFYYGKFTIPDSIDFAGEKLVTVSAKDLAGNKLVPFDQSSPTEVAPATDLINGSSFVRNDEG